MQLVIDVRVEVPSLTQLKVQIFADGADEKSILELVQNPLIRGVTTNPTLMRAAGISDFEGFARGIVDKLGQKPISFEVFADEISEMERQARKIASWGEQVYVKIPITNTRGESTARLVRLLSGDGIKLNVTALLTLDQVRTAAAELAGGPPSYISVFAGRIADTGRDPVAIMAQAVEIMAPYPNEELIWASPREVLNIIQADQVGCHVITVTPDILKKLPTIGRDLSEFSLDTVKMFYRDAQAAGYSL